MLDLYKNMSIINFQVLLVMKIGTCNVIKIKILCTYSYCKNVMAENKSCEEQIFMSYLLIAIHTKK